MRHILIKLPIGKMHKGFTILELLVVIAIIGILAAIGIPTYQGFQQNAKYTASKTNFNNVMKHAGMLALECELDGKITVLANDGKTGVLKSFVCENENTNSISHLIRDHYHYQGFKNPLTGYSATWWFGTPLGAALENKDGYILFDGNPTNECVIKITSSTLNPDTNTTEIFSSTLSFHGLVSGCK